MLVDAKVEGVALMGGANCRLKVRIGNEQEDVEGMAGEMREH